MSCPHLPSFITEVVPSGESQPQVIHCDVQAPGEVTEPNVCDDRNEVASAIDAANSLLLLPRQMNVKDMDEFGNVRKEHKRDSADTDAEELDYLTMLPPEIWKMIVNLVDKPKDLENLSVASPFFREMLMEKRVDFLAPEVLKLVTAKGYLSPARANFMTGKRPNDLPTCYNARSVCKTWCTGVDGYFEDRFTNPRVQFNSKFGKRSPFYKIPARRFGSRFDLMFFPSHFEDSHQNTTRNPFVGRAVDLTLHPDIFEMLTTLFRLYGHHVWGFKFRNYGVLNLNILYGHLAAMPNLKRFEIADYRGSILEPGNGPPPVLPHLITFKSKIGLALQSGILLANPTITSLLLDLGSDPPAQSLALPNVENLKLILHEKGGLTPIETVNLHMLTIHWQEFGKCRPVGDGSLKFYREFFDLMNKNWENARSLKELELELPRLRTERDICQLLCGSGALRLKLIRAEKIKILMNNLCCVDFLLSMKDNLKYLRVKIKTQWPEKIRGCIRLAFIRQTVKFIGYERRMLKSNIWEIFPKLEKVVCEGHLSSSHNLTYESFNDEICHYTRADWEKSKL